MTIKSTLRVKLYFISALSFSVMILILSLINLNSVNIIKLNASDKFYHLVCYAILSFLWSLFANAKWKGYPLKNKTIVSTIIIFFGIIIEYLQLVLTNYRSFDWWDVLANTAGVIFGLIIFSIFQKVFNHQKI